MFYIQSHISCFTSASRGRWDSRNWATAGQWHFWPRSQTVGGFPRIFKPLRNSRFANKAYQKVQDCLDSVQDPHPNNFQNIWLTLDSSTGFGINMSSSRQLPFSVSHAGGGSASAGSLARGKVAAVTAKLGINGRGQEFHGIQWFPKIKSNRKKHLLCIVPNVIRLLSGRSTNSAKAL